MNIFSGFLGEGWYFKERKDHVVKLLLKVKPTQMGDWAETSTEGRIIQTYTKHNEIRLKPIHRKRLTLSTVVKGILIAPLRKLSHTP